MLVGMLHHPFNYTEVSTVLIRTWSKCKCTASDVFLFLMRQSSTVTGWESLLSLFNGGSWLCPLFERDGGTKADLVTVYSFIRKWRSHSGRSFVVVGQRWPRLWCVSRLKKYVQFFLSVIFYKTFDAFEWWKCECAVLQA